MEHKDAATAFTEPDKAFQHLIDTIHSYLPDAGCDDVKKAYALASEAHKEQHRASGEPYILHPLAVAQILADMKIDTRTITASLLHDVVEDTDYTLDDLKNLFGKEVAFLVDGVTKLSRLNYRTKEDQQLNSMRKIIKSYQFSLTHSPKTEIYYTKVNSICPVFNRIFKFFQIAGRQQQFYFLHNCIIPERI